MGALKDVKVIISIISIILITVALVLGFQTVSSWKEGYDQNETKKETLKSTSGIIEDGAKADEDRYKTDQAVGDGRQTFSDVYQGAMNHEPETADRANRSVPDSVRQAFRQRRLARERSGCAGEQCGKGSQAASSAKR